jgi:CheY-like chemotaxis protein
MLSHTLYAEDDENDAFFMQRAFTPLAHASLTIVPDGGVAISYLEGAGEYSDRVAHPLPRLLVLDIKMPHVTGLEVLEWLRKQEPFNALPVVMLTSSTQLKDIEFSRKHGANAYLVKPSQSRDLAGIMKRLTEALPITSEGGKPWLALPENILIERPGIKP